MNARLSSLLVAGGVVLAGIHTGSLHASPSAETAFTKATLASATLNPAGAGAKVWLGIPGLAAPPRVQVLSSPLRVVLDLPDVERGSVVTKKDLLLLSHSLIQKARLGQFATTPRLVTRLVLEVAPGTQVVVGSGPDGVQLMLSPGVGHVQARLEDSVRPMVLPTTLPDPTGMVSASLPPVAVPAVASATPSLVKPLTALPSLGSGFQILPQLTASTALPVASQTRSRFPSPKSPTPPHPSSPGPAAALWERHPPATQGPRSPSTSRTPTSGTSCGSLRTPGSSTSTWIPMCRAVLESSSRIPPGIRSWTWS